MIIQDYINEIVANPLQSGIIILNLIVIEALLAIDNAAVLATMVMNLPPDQRGRALRYGIFIGYILRGLCLLFASILIKIWWLKPLGGAYLVYLVYSWWKGKQTVTKEDDLLEVKGNWIYQKTSGLVGTFWANVLSIELMDLTFSIDNVFAAVAFSENIVLIWLGVFIGILAMRFVAQRFVVLMEKYPFLEASAFIIIGLLGMKLILATVEHLYPDALISKALGSHTADWGFSILTMLIFFIPIVYTRFNPSEK
jgi:YkoY family integral membrane protein